ncbi:uncharacterized protein EKO05_0004770 [Ascochyta rabiei]|uniref:Zinc ion binding n=1 Tax=Didymella rabiei TaxID=5454 RepID=A0A163JIF2_DIDRA|nr:uncharacterized protein EKO05_0004770 [Ascochyta rabiei]KZM26380.1 zinc ion binding [Ascochyta rabiei]UPX14281.1 hypothetical protein EKO05_0004770 [Ascochyta rabiei]
MQLSLALSLAALAALASASIAPSNTSTVNARYFQGTLPLQHALGDGQQIAELIPLTREGAQRSIEGSLYRTNGSTVSNMSDGDIAYISCNPADYPGFVGAQGLFDQAYGNGNANLSGIILYSTVTDYCAYDPDGNAAMSAFPVLSMTNKTDSAAVLAQIDNLAVHMKYFVQVQGRGNDASPNNTQQQNPLGPSPSTGVAMIILYSITGIITALFLVIILTGAIRAHRHPERYGPRNVLGRPRQSRAKGLGRAILETIPIIKFGEKEPVKPTDVELASTSESAHVEGATINPATATPPSETTTATATQAASNDALPATARTPQEPAMTEQPDGIAAAVTPAAVMGASSDTSSNDDTLGCTICTEDFEKGQDIRVLPCNHKFHPDCVDPWLLNVSGTCPLCRVDLRPTNTNDSSNSHADELAPPLNSDAETSHRRRTALRGILFFRQHPDAPAEDRISALRRLREQRRNQSGDVAEANANASVDDVSRADHRSRRISARLGDVFSGRTRRATSPAQPTGNPGGAA